MALLQCLTIALAVLASFHVQLVRAQIQIPLNYFANLEEEQPNDTEVVRVIASYINSFGIPRSDGTFSISSDGDARFFSIETISSPNQNVGIIRTSVVFDRDAQNAQLRYMFPVTYTTPNGDSSDTQVEVNLLDINDNSPKFSESVFTVSVFEETPPGANIFNVTASDPDQVLVEEMLVDIGQGAQAVMEVYTVDNGRILFSITSGNELGHFTIDRDNGTLSISLGASLDVDSIDSYNLTVMATDGGGLNNTATVLITILDSNDNPPQILSPLGVDVSISEDTALGFVILEEINATDLDSSQNADISFLITAGDRTNSFTIDETTGEIIVSAPLDRERGAVVNLTVVARDNGVPVRLQDSIFVVVRLLDVNDYTPTFAESAYTFTVNERSRVGTSVAQIVAEDLDEGTNGTVTYTILEGSEEKFYIDPSTGALFTNGTLDREDVSLHMLLVEAVDNPLNESLQLSSQVNVTILIGDFNDNSPVFNQSFYVASILDNTRRGTSIVRVNATDRDSGSNGEITYRIEVQDPMNPTAFAIRGDTGIVFLNQPITFEDQREFHFTVRALDGNSVSPFFTDVPVTIFIHNVNDNPPSFEEEAYNVTIVETTPINTVVLNVTAHDSDDGLIGDIWYRIISDFDEAGSFEVNETTGDIFVNSTLDFDFRDFIFFQVEVYDGGFPEPYTDVTNVTVFLIGANDEPPSIVFPDGFQIVVPENTEPEIDLVTLRDYTTDPDFGMGGEFMFGLVAIYDEYSTNDSFSLNETTGLITSLRTFDREQQPDGIVVAIETIDFGTPRVSQVTNITITIGDKNDHNPYFETNTSATVYEFMPPGIEVLSDYQAMDEDNGTNAQLEYQILLVGEGAERFTIDRETGVIRTAERLNKTEQLFYNLTIIACDQGMPQQLCGYGAVFIEVLDANDMIPVFTESVYTANFSEYDSVGTFITQVNATDMDIGTNADLEYFLAPNTSHVDRFFINSTTGELFTDDIFDRENESVFELSIIAVDMGLVPLTGMATVQVFVLDFNDNTPIFNETSYEAFVVENSANGTFVVKVLATDEDAEFPNNAIEYNLRGNRSDEFHVEPSTGVVTVDGEVDWEEGGVFNITVVATDLGNPPRSSDVVLTIYIEDVNDQPPIFVPDSLNLTILENTHPGNGTDVGIVVADDLDSDGNNSLVTFSVLMDFSNNKFTLDSEGLVRFVKGSLNRERRDRFDLLIRASDHGSPQLYTDATLIITVLDANDFDPIFDQALYTGSVSEAANIGTPVLTIHATDTDIGPNGELRYSIPDIAYQAYFAVNESTGVIYTDTDAFDFENITEYLFEVFVCDLGEPSRNATSRVKIFITDANDHKPVFNQSEYSQVIRENLAPGTVVLRVAATDEDIEDNAIIEFSISPRRGSGMFGINNETGVLYTTSYINREDTPSFNLTIIANNSASIDPLSSEVQVIVDISDLNDMHPTFDPVTNVFVFENASVNSTIYTLTAYDGDEGMGGVITYTLLEGNEEGYFELDSQTGEITLLRELDFEDRTHFLFAVQATDGSEESLSNFTNVLIQVQDTNDNVPVFTSDGYTVTINSEVPIGSTLIMVTAFDRDVVSEDELTYSLLGDDQGLFELESTTQAVIRTAMLLRSFVDQSFNFTLLVSDSMHTSMVPLIVHIQGGGDPTLPNFNTRTYGSTISEGASVNHIVFEFSGRVLNDDTYAIVSGNPGDIFSIDSGGTVRLVVSNVLDFESQYLYQLTVSASNTAGNRAFATLNVSITDENEHTPMFISESVFIALPETTPGGEPFFVVMATDRDGASPANKVVYSIVSPSVSIANTFQINSRTGALSLRRDRALNFESGPRNFTFTVSASDLATPRYTSEIPVLIEVLNGNSHQPRFDPSRYNVELIENATVGINIVNVSASDQDIGSSGVITYGLRGNHRYLDFRIDTFTGQIFINSELDFERQTLYSLEVVASDGGNPNQVAVGTLEIQIQDLNDNTPIWEQDAYFANVIENSTLGSFVIQVQATDIDQVDSTEINGEIVFYNRNGYVSYSITQGDAFNHFEIDPDTGVVSVASSLDRERFPEYNLTLNATDGGDLYANAYLHIVIHDVNDETPMFTQDPYLVNLPENTNNGTLILTVQATDTDLNQNSEVIYQFQDALFDYYDDSLTFFLNDTTGELFLQVPIDREEISFYSLTVYAIDMGVVPLTGVVEVQITVLDINEFAPSFTQDEFAGEVFENEPVGFEILQVNTTDMDFDENSTVLYTIISGNELQLFDIVANSGVVRVAREIDFEQGSVYELVVMATDSGPIETRLTNTTNVTVFILDRNDNAPIFDEEIYIASVFENSIPGEVVLTVNASDADSSSNAEFVFALDYLGDSEAERNFVIDPINGTILLSSNTDLNRERTVSYNIAINVSDLGTPSLTSTVPLTIFITDTNDNTPQFIAPFFEGSVSENQIPGAPILSVSATDEDIGQNGDIVYEIVSLVEGEGECLSLCGSQPFCRNLNSTNSNVPFTVDEQNGIISSLYSLDRENTSRYVLLVQANDSPVNETQLSNTTCVHVTILDENDEYPQFSASNYIANVSEYSTGGVLVVQVVAEDADVGTNAAVSYQLVTGSDRFTIHPMTGRVLTLDGGFDRETQDLYNLTVVATDSGFPPLSSTAVVMVTIHDENDNAPMFSETVYLASVEENVQGATVLQVNASDPDIGTNSELRYSIVSSLPVEGSLHFDIDPVLGVITTSQSLDREAFDFYTLTLMVVDNGIPSLSGQALINVSIVDANDHAPVFQGTPYSVEVMENVEMQLPLLTITAVDEDIGTNGDVYYTLVTVTDSFVLNQTSGELYLISPLNAEFSLQHNLTVEASNGLATPTQTSEVLVVVNVIDLNDNAPFFSQLDYNIPLSEASHVGSSVIQLTTFDNDATSPNSDVTFAITSGFNTSLFAINSTTGVVYVADVLDRESEPVHVLEVSVYDGGSPQMSSITTLTIVLLDSNDNTPIFEQSFYSFSLEENAPPSFFVGKITARDLDLQNITYSLPDNDQFTINNTSGEIFTAAILDRETQEVYSFTAVASDGGMSIERTSDVIINVTLLDQNDVSPVFVNSTYTVAWNEDTALGTVLLTVEALDPDLVENGTVVYSILGGNDSSFFSINNTESDVILEQEFDREVQDLFNITISACDLGHPSLCGSTIVLISVLDDNDNVPILNATQYTASLPEDTPVGTVVSYIGASDLDILQNARITFTLSEDFNGTFSIGAETGILVLSKSLDYEFAQSYSFSVTARDNGTTPLYNTSSVFVEVVDLNDNSPVFDSSVYQISIPENTILSTPVFNIPATDADSTTNSELRYSILGGNVQSAFTVDEIFGDVIVADYLDREINDFYSLSLQVVDLGTPQFTATTQLEISILDVNDHPPVFDSNIYSISISELTEIGTRIYTLEASDLDIDSNANLTFSIIAGNTNDTFEIDQLTGDVSVNQSLDFESIPSYALTVRVSDNGSPTPLFDTALLLVQLLDENEHPPSFHQSMYYVNISQNTVIGTPIGHFIAVDDDPSSSGDISYSLVDGSMYFQVDPLEGTVFVSSVLTPGAFMLQLEANDGRFVTSLSIHVVVVPVFVAMTIPLFRPPAFDFEISEMSQVGSLIGELGHDNATILQSNQVADRFAVDSAGRVTVAGYLDREVIPVYVLNVWLPGNTDTPLYAVMTIRVLDSNDIAPVFEVSEYAVSVSELTPTQTTILTLRAYDGDQPGINADFLISLNVEGNEMGNFNVDPSTGALVVSGSLDYEVQSSYLLTANVTNHLASPQLYSTAEILVELIDENDNSPQFTQMVYQVQFTDSIPVGTEILVLEASDADSGSNSDLVYAITHINVPLTFTINQTTGAIATNATFNAQIASSYVISAMVSDRGSPQPRAATTTVFVTVSATNMYSPQFTQPNGYNVVIPETLSVGESVVQISAFDPDAPNDTLSLVYAILSGDHEDKFFINPLTGLVTVSADLDYDDQSIYYLILQATDSGTPPRSNIVSLNISLADLNNHDPSFEQDVYQVAIYENITVGSMVVQVVASDPDALDIRYQITENAYENGTQLFAINSTTGDVFTAAPIDREFADTLEILVSAIDSGYPIQRSNSIPVTFIVLDLNDNAPVFDQSEIIVPVVRLLSSGKIFGTVTATDADIIGPELTYTITADNSDGLFSLNSTTGELKTLDRLPETVEFYQLNVTAFDGIFTTAVAVRIEFINDGDFCEESGFCTSVREVNCTFDIFPFIECNPFCTGQYELSQRRRVCLSYSCLTTSLVPCVAMETCLPPNMACAGVCPQGMSVCPTTNICHVTSLLESCDASNQTCLVGQSLVQLNDGSRFCSNSLSLPPIGQNCTESGFIYCRDLDECQNISTPLLCQACPNELMLCVDTGECVPDLIQCCGPNGNYCEVLNACLPVGDRCDLPNIAPELNTSLIYLESITSFSPDTIYSGEGHVISLLLSNELGAYPAVDLQGDELSIAIVEVSPVETTAGEWQYTLCADSASSAGICSPLSQNWVRIDMERISQTNALLLPSLAKIRFVRKAVELDGAVWLRAKLWDGNEDRYLSPRRDLVAESQPRFESTLPFSSNGAFSENSTLLVVLVHPLIQPPTFSAAAQLQFTELTEDVIFSRNLGNSVGDIVTSVDIPEFKVLSEGTIQGFPIQNGDGLYYEQLLPAAVREAYHSDVARVNPTRIERVLALESGQLPGIGVSLDNTFSTESGTWQVSVTGDPRRFINVSSLITDNELLLLNLTSSLHFLPAAAFCGQSSILVRAWDGFWNESFARTLGNGYIVASLPEGTLSPTLSLYNLNQWERASLEVACTPDKPVVLDKRVLLEPIPYRISYHYERLFTALVNRGVTSLRRDEERFSDLLHLALEQPVQVQRFSPAFNDQTYVSFTVEDNVLSFEETQDVLQERQNVLADLNFDIINLSQDASYGRGAGCMDESPQHYHGVNVNSFVSQYATDNDGDYLGMAVVGVDSTQVQGVWQYHRGNWNISAAVPDQFNENQSIWLNFPSIPFSESSAFLLHGNDRFRFLPNPDSYWTDSPPTIRVKIWDNSLGGIQMRPPASEVFTVNINTDPLTDTFQSLNSPLGLFSDDVMIIEASRYGCDGVVNSGLVHDVCCVCGGDGASCEGCDGVRGSNTRRDSCDICGGTTSTCLRCDFIPFSGTGMGPCLECVSNVLIPTNDERYTPYHNASFLDCNNQCYGAALLDTCGVCSGGTTSHDFNNDMDCADVCFGTAAIDFCGECNHPDTYNHSIDCTGVCYGSYQTDSCGVCQLPRLSGRVLENRDCDGLCYGEALLDSCGVCYGGMTDTPINSTVDQCGVCAGDNSSCTGCDSIINSGQSVDSCDECGGKNCNCFRIASIYPSSGPRTGGTEVTVHGAGFFHNDTRQLQFQFDREQPNCGAPYRYPNSSSVSILCRFISPQQQQILVSAVPIDQSSVKCITRSIVSFGGVFSVQIQVANGPFSNPMSFFYEDYSSIAITEITPTSVPINEPAVITFLGSDFINSSFSACLVYNYQSCTNTPSVPSPLVVPASYESPSSMSCLLPQSDVPCRVTVRLTLDGQMSGVLDSDMTDFVVTYRHSAPLVELIHFSNDLSNLLVQFDRSVAMNSDSDQLNCEEIFSNETYSLLGGSGASCSWTNDIQDSITIDLPMTAAVSVGSLISFRNGVLKTRGPVHSFSVSDTTVLVDSDLNAIQPIAVLNGPSSIPSCGQVTFSGIDSLYSGYRGFEYHWSILVEDSSIENFADILDYLDTLGTSASEITLNSALFLSSVEYYLQLSVRSSIGLRSEVQNVLLFKESSPSPMIRIVGLSQRQLTAGEDLLMQSYVTSPDCFTPIGQFEFNWRLIRIVDERRNVTNEEDLSNVHRMSSEIIFPSYLFQQDTKYIVMLSVTAGGLGSSEAAVNVTVLPPATKAVIVGGNRTVTSDRDVVLDARNSTIDPSLVQARFVWSCEVNGSFDACYNQSSSLNSSIPVPILIPDSHFVIIPGTDLVAGQTYMFKLILQQGTYQSTASVIIELVSVDMTPIVEILPPSSELSTSQEILLSGLVYSNKPVYRVIWESVSLPGQGFIDLADTALVKSQTVYSAPKDLSQGLSLSSLPASLTINQTSRANLVLESNVLQPGVTYTFRLAAINIETDEQVGYAHISINPDPAPHSIILQSNPIFGVAMETEFSLSVSNVVDNVVDLPLAYQYGIIRNYADVSISSIQEEDIHWLSGVQASSSFVTVLPSGDPTNNFSLAVLVRVFDRKGGFADALSFVRVQPNAAANSVSFYTDLITQIGNEFEQNKDWNRALSSLVSILIEFDSNSNLQSQTFKRQSLDLFLSIFDSHLPPTKTHYTLTSSILTLILKGYTNLDTNRQTRIINTLNTIVQWFMSETAIESTFTKFPPQRSGEPLLLRDSYQISSFELLSGPLAVQLLGPWLELLTVSSSSQISESFVQNTENIATILCQESTTGKEATHVETTPAMIYTKMAQPRGSFNASNFIVNFGSSVMQLYQSTACVTDNAPCLETCFSSVAFDDDFLNPSPGGILTLDASSQLKLRSEIEGSNPLSVERISNVFSVSLLIPSQSRYLQVRNLNSPIQVLIPQLNPIPDSEYQPICLYREVGGASGFDTPHTWQLDTTAAPDIQQIGSITYYVCEYNHLSEFTIGLLPPPVITTPPPETTTPPPTTIPTTTEPASTTEEVPTTLAERASPPPVAAIAVVIILVLLVTAVVIVIVVVLVVWKKKRSKKVKVVPEIDTSETKEPVVAISAGPLTPEQSRVPMQVIKCTESGERSRVGTINVLPSIRLRELRHQLVDSFTAYKGKPFYFLTRQLCDIEPAAEQQQFVSLVFGDKPIFIREVGVENEQTRKHFCVCGNAAQLECSNCSSQGYCSSDCQMKHWSEQHQRECSRLAEKKKRSDILFRRQSTTIGTDSTALSPTDERPRRITLAAMSSTGPQGAGSATTPTNWKGFMSTSKSFQPPMAVGRERAMSVPAVSATPVRLSQQVATGTTLSELATRPLPPTIQEESLTGESKKQTPKSSTALAPLIRSTSTSFAPRRSGHLPPLSRSTSLQQNTAGVPFNQPRTSLVMPSTAPVSAAASDVPSLQSPLRTQQPLFTRPTVRQSLSLPRPTPSRHLSIESVGSLDFSLNISIDVRNEPLIESDEDEYDTSSSTHGSPPRTHTSNTAAAQTSSRPPSLVVRKKRSLAGPPRSESSSSETSSSSEDSSSENDNGQDDIDQREHPTNGTENQTHAPGKEEGTSEPTTASMETTPLKAAAKMEPDQPVNSEIGHETKFDGEVRKSDNMDSGDN